MRCLTLHQPWASAIIYGPKDIENRTWRPSPQRLWPGGWLAIHAGKVIDRDAVKFIHPHWPEVLEQRVVTSAILGAVKFEGVVRIEDLAQTEHGETWAEGPWCWLLGERVVLPEPIELGGQRGLWKVPAEIRDAIKAAYLAGGPDNDRAISIHAQRRYAERVLDLDLSRFPDNQGGDGNAIAFMRETHPELLEQARAELADLIGDKAAKLERFDQRVKIRGVRVTLVVRGHCLVTVAPHHRRGIHRRM